MGLVSDGNKRNEDGTSLAAVAGDASYPGTPANIIHGETGVNWANGTVTAAADASNFARRNAQARQAIAKQMPRGLAFAMADTGQNEDAYGVAYEHSFAPPSFATLTTPASPPAADDGSNFYTYEANSDEDLFIDAGANNSFFHEGARLAA